MTERVRLGYAATEPGNQSDTQTASVTLATPATTARGLYVAMTRGRDENLVLLVTDTHDVAEARDVLEAVIASDRADVPSTTQRRTLAQQQPAVRPTPRCHVPDWFHDLRDGLVAEHRDASRAVAESDATRQRLVAAVATAEQRLAAADRVCTPFDVNLRAATVAVTRAEQARRDAQRHLDKSGLRGRRHARRDLAAAEERLLAARDEYDRAEDDARPATTQRSIARQQSAAARDKLHTHDMFEKWRYLPEQLRALEQHLAALDTWHEWASGKPVDHRQLANAVTTLHESSRHRPGDDTRVLGHALDYWAQQRGIQLDVREPPQQQHNSRVVELDFL